ncbi:MAG: hypothetical protein M0T74_11975, partial [Desulfitobacterium hafniense]|nr:hypothetical protein [Desulfitobacterium hafniense]
ANEVMAARTPMASDNTPAEALVTDIMSVTSAKSPAICRNSTEPPIWPVKSHQIRDPLIPHFVVIDHLGSNGITLGKAHADFPVIENSELTIVAASSA